MSALNHLPEKFICVIELNYPGHPFPPPPAFLQLYQGNLQELSSQFPSTERSHPQHLLRVKFAAAREEVMLCKALPFSPLADDAAPGTAHAHFVVACGLHD